MEAEAKAEAAAAAASTTTRSAHCLFWLPKKNRFCAKSPLHHSSSSSVLEDNLDNHLTKCPLHKQAQSLYLQPYYQKGINAGSEPEEYADDAVHHPRERQKPTAVFTSELKRQSIHRKTVPEFFELISKIKTIHASLCIHIHDSFQIPDAFAAWSHTQQMNQKLPFQEKHALQQASILGNLELFGVLEKHRAGDLNDASGQSHRDVPAVVEFGAGRGYLTQMLADCYGIRKVTFVERKSYKLKADRSLRQIESLTLERLRIDIEDLNLRAVESLRGASYLAIGKHLCGPATDMTLRCCISPQGVRDVADESESSCYLRGLAVAACCHHLCQWKHYINKSFMSNLGITKEEFHAITWFTSWAVDGDCKFERSDVDRSQNLKHTEKEELGWNLNGSEVGEIIRNMGSEERAVLGMMCKEIIDVGRVRWVEEQGLDAHMVKYVAASISPENHLLIAAVRDVK